MQGYAPVPASNRRRSSDPSGVYPRSDGVQADLSTDAVRWHSVRHRSILATHPEIKKLFGFDRTSALWITVLVCLQYTMAIELRHAPLWMIFVFVLLIGAPIAHALGVLIHECSHNLVFRSTWANRVIAIFANIGMGAPGAMAFRHQHLLHHRYLGDGAEPDGRDTQAPQLREILWAGRSTWRKFLGFTFGRFFLDGRSSDKPPRDAWVIANQVLRIAAVVGLSLLAGLRSTSYLMFSLFFAFGPHPLGARRISEHVTVRPDQPTISYYGPGNRISFDVGYHVEHHDFPHVPWRRLRTLRRSAGEYYAPLARVESWSRLLWEHWIDPNRHRGEYVGFESYLAASGNARSKA
jgi:sphingolipid 4-desaturase/C4-monooxygenase